GPREETPGGHDRAGPNCGTLAPMQYHPGAGWLEENGYPADLAKCVHLPRAADVATKRNTNEQPWVILHELAHAYHDQVLGFDNPRVREAFENYKKSGRGDKALLYNGKRVRHYALTNPGVLRRDDRGLFRRQRFLPVHARRAERVGAGNLFA